MCARQVVGDGAGYAGFSEARREVVRAGRRAALEFAESDLPIAEVADNAWRNAV